ncbi:hypothetical protein PsYK624_129650 [Phanerochaete sordida]|uniref:Uncharacterized protein n=1 Tax=Phanerochaete sordida TaxID=48140 RepID=A0A9P3LJK4_9APHY|nr:hypothetical protein PsYK624_129650 [Phanerochaete sordida]
MIRAHGRRVRTSGRIASSNDTAGSGSSQSTTSPAASFRSADVATGFGPPTASLLKRRMWRGQRKLTFQPVSRSSFASLNTLCISCPRQTSMASPGTEIRVFDRSRATSSRQRLNWQCLVVHTYGARGPDLRTKLLARVYMRPEGPGSSERA